MKCLLNVSAAFSSRMFQGFPKELMQALQREPLTGHFHHYGLSLKVEQIPRPVLKTKHYLSYFVLLNKCD